MFGTGLNAPVPLARRSNVCAGWVTRAFTMATPRPERPRQSQNMPYAMGDINTTAAFADFGNSLFMERCGVQATL